MTKSTDPTEWNIVTKSHGGVVSILKNLTEDQARQTMLRLGAPNPWKLGAELAAITKAWAMYPYPSSNGGYLGKPYPGIENDNALIQLSAWGPDGADLEVYPKPDGWDAEYEAALAVALAKRRADLGLYAKAEDA
jgi:hypothetical protein